MTDATVLEPQQEAEAQASEPVLLSRSEAAALLGVSGDTIYRWATKGLIPSITRPSGLRMYRKAELEAIKAYWLEDEPADN